MTIAATPAVSIRRFQQRHFNLTVNFLKERFGIDLFLQFHQTYHSPSRNNPIVTLSIHPGSSYPLLQFLLFGPGQLPSRSFSGNQSGNMIQSTRIHIFIFYQKDTIF